MKFKVGQRVRCVEGEGKSGDGWELGKVFTIKSIFDDERNSYASIYHDETPEGVFEDHLEAYKKTIEDVDYPDIIENTEDKHEVLGRLNDLVFLTGTDNFDKTIFLLTIPELKSRNYKPVDNEPEKEKMITIKGKEYSEDTIHKSLKEYVKWQTTYCLT